LIVVYILQWSLSVNFYLLIIEMSDRDYSNVEVKYNRDGEKVVRRVEVRGGEGYKSVTFYKGGKKHHTVRKSIRKSHVKKIQRGCFVPGLFSDCKRKTHKNKHV